MRASLEGRSLHRVLVATFVLLTACGDQATQPLSDPRGLILLGTEAYPAEIYVMRPDGSGLRQLTSDSVNDLDATWSPDGKRIVFSSASTEGDQWADLHVMNADGGQRHLLYHGSGSAYWPRWSPDGSRIAFAQVDAGVGLRVYVMESDGSTARLVTSTARSIAPDWSPDGSRLLFLAERPGRASRSMYTIRTDGSGERLVAGDTACVGNVQEARYSPDGSRIVYRCDDVPGGAIFVINADGTAPLMLSPVVQGPPYKFDISPVWSPDGAQIAFHRGLAVWAMDPTGANATRVGGADVVGLVPSDWGAAAH